MRFIPPILCLAATLVSASPIGESEGLSKRSVYNPETADPIQGFDLDYSTTPPKQPFTVTASNHSFVYVETTWGMKLSDANWATTRNNARAAGLITGGVHHPSPAVSSGAAQAQYFTDHGGKWINDGKTLPGVLSLNLNFDSGSADCGGGLTSANLRSWINDFIAKYKSLNGREPVIQTSWGWVWLCYGTGTKPSNPFTTNDVWYIGDPTGSWVTGTGWTNWKFRTWALATADNSTGVGEVEFDGNLAALKAYIS